MEDDFDDTQDLFDVDPSSTWFGRTGLLLLTAVTGNVGLICLDHWTLLPVADRPGWDVARSLLLAAYSIALVVSICFYTYGYYFTLISTHTLSHEDQLHCVKANIRAWVGNFETRTKSELARERFQRKCMAYQRDLASYMADPNLGPGAVYTKKENLGLAAWVVISYIACAQHVGYFLGIWCHVNDFEDHDTLSGKFWLSVSVLEFIGMTAMFWFPRLFLRDNPGRYGRFLRMGSLMRQIRKDCLVADAEKGDGVVKEGLKWWIENLLEVEEFGLDEKSDGGKKANLSDEEKVRPTSEEKIIDFLVERIKI